MSGDIAILQLLIPYLKAGILDEIDLEFARILGDPGESPAEETVLAAVLSSYWYRQGNICLTLHDFAGKGIFEAEKKADRSLPEITAPAFDEWHAKLSSSPVVGPPDSFKPLILDGGRLYLQKLWHYEQLIAGELLARCTGSVPGIHFGLLKEGLHRFFPSGDLFEMNWQQTAAALSVLKRFSVISGGPGTGKTTTVVRIIALLLEQSSGPRGEAGADIALAAPTGKAAARLKESVLRQKEHLPVSADIRKAIPEQAVTLHQLLGARPGSGTWRYSKENPLPYDAVVIDEASMVDQTMMAKLLQALPRNSRLILLGDKDQLASVEAGSVLGDICMPDDNRYSEAAVDTLRRLEINIPDKYLQKKAGPLLDNITFLEKSYRFDEAGGIGRFSSAINSSRADDAVDILRSSKYPAIRFREITGGEDIGESLFAELLEHARKLAGSADHAAASGLLKRQMTLCVHRRGFLGSENINRQIERLLRRELSLSRYDPWYRGRPVLVTRNNYTLKLRNGDLGIYWDDNDQNPALFFEGEEGRFRTVNPARLSRFENAYALTVHKSQGSEFEHVHIVLPAEPSPILTKELLYTAVTRARTEVTVWGTVNLLKHGILRSIRRSSGLRERLWSR